MSKKARPAAAKSQDSLPEICRKTNEAAKATGAEHPIYLAWEGKVYTATGKTGTHIKTGTEAAEFAHRTEGLDERVWRLITGEVDPD